MIKGISAPPIPADGVEFYLTLGPTDPMEMVRADGYDPKGWKFTGSPVAPQTRSFMLVRADSCRNLDEVREKLAEIGFIPQGQWCEAFKRACPEPDGRDHIGFADPSWVHPRGSASFPVLIGDGRGWVSYFYWAEYARGRYWRWLVEVK